MFAVVVIIVLVVWYCYTNTPTYLGKKGENSVRRKLSKLPPEYKVLNDVVLKTERGTTQIDHIVISRYGVFAIETKNYRGRIYGSDSSSEWTQIIQTDVRYRRKWWKVYTHITKNKLYNPVKQSLGHAYEIKKHCTGVRGLYVVPIVVFTGRADLSGISTSHDVVDLAYLLPTIEKYREVQMSNSEVNLVLDALISQDERENISNREHVRNIRQAERERQAKINSGICPRCGGLLVKRQGVRGSFYGCSNYPKCKFTANV